MTANKINEDIHMNPMTIYNFSNCQSPCINHSIPLALTQEYSPTFSYYFEQNKNTSIEAGVFPGDDQMDTNSGIVKARFILTDSIN